MNLVQVAPSLLVGKSRIFEMNAGIFVRGGDAYLVDPGIFPDEIDRIARGSEAQLRGIVITHSHWDHILGPERIGGVPIIAQARAAFNLAADCLETDGLVAQRLAAHGFTRETPFAAPQIDVSFGDELELPFAASSLRLLHSPGHCDDQLVVYDALEQTLWAADMLSDVEIPFVQDVKAYRTTLDRLAQLDIARLVPGHGNATSDSDDIRGRFDWDREYLMRLDDEVTREASAGRSLEQVRDALSSWPLRRPDINAAEHLRNIGTVYSRLARS